MLKALTFHKSGHILYYSHHVCLPAHTCIWPSHHTVPFCPSCYGDGGWICQCSVMATLSRVTADQYAVLSKETAMRCIWVKSETLNRCLCPVHEELISLPLSNISGVLWSMWTELLICDIWKCVLVNIWAGIWALMRIDLLVPQEMCSLLSLYNTWYYWDIISNMIIVMIYFFKLKIIGSVSELLNFYLQKYRI